MNFIFTNLFENESHDIGTSKNTSLEVLYNPDKIQEIKFDDLYLHLFMKKEHYGDSHLIILTNEIDGKQNLILPFRVFPDLYPNIEILEPIMILQLLAQKFGLLLKIGSEQRRFIYRATISITQDRERIIEILNPMNHSFLQSVFVKKIKSGGKIIVECALAFCARAPSFYGTSDIGFHFTPDQLGGDPWTKDDAYKEKSPLTYAPNVKTPVQFIHSYDDYRCWIDQSIIFYTALKHLGKETQLVLFMEGSHVFRSLAKPSIRKKRYEHIIKWFDTHLQKENI